MTRQRTIFMLIMHFSATTKTAQSKEIKTSSCKNQEDDIVNKTNAIVEYTKYMGAVSGVNLV